MQKITHASNWRKNPTKSSVFVSCFVNHTFSILNQNPKIKKVLDVACGNGLGVTLPLLRRKLDVYSFDYLSVALNAVKINAKKENLKPKLKKANMFKKFPYNDNSFDSTFCFQAMYHARLEQIMFTLSEIKRVTKKNGYFFGTFLTLNQVKKINNRYYIDVKLENDKIIKNYHLQDKSQPHLFYYLSKDFEYMVPHYYFAKDELKIILSQFFRDVKIKLVKKCDLSYFYLAYGKI
jgi:ubiquinone/menaquinone biosynthesis C-methylase UbiE